MFANPHREARRLAVLADQAEHDAIRALLAFLTIDDAALHAAPCDHLAAARMEARRTLDQCNEAAQARRLAARAARLTARLADGVA